MSPSTEYRPRSNSYTNIHSYTEREDTRCLVTGTESTSSSSSSSRNSRNNRNNTSYTTKTLPLPHRQKHSLNKGCAVTGRSLILPDKNYSPTGAYYSTNGAHYSPAPGALQRAPSQVTMHYTTVPQSLVSRQLGSRHHPTRSSLRHSRLLVLVRNGTVPRKYLPGVVERERLGLIICLSQLFVGLILTGLAVWRIAASKNIAKPSDWPYYSGIMMLMSGWFCLVLLVCCRYHYPGASHQPCVIPVRTYHIMFCVLLSALSAVSTFIAFVCHLLHLVTYASSICQEATTPPNWPEDTCVCLSSYQLWEEGELVYPAASCTQVNTFLTPFLLSLLLFNVLAFISTSSFIFIILSSKHIKTFKYWRRAEPEKPTKLPPPPLSP